MFLQGVLVALPFVLLPASANGIDAGEATGPLTIPEAWSAGPSHPMDWTLASTFGYSVASAGDVNGDGYDDAIVGAPGWHLGGPAAEQQGRVHLFNGSPYGLSAEPDWRVTGRDFLSAIGTWVGSAGDVNGDGYDDVIYSGGGDLVQDHLAYLHLGSPSGPSIPPDWTHATGAGSSPFGPGYGFPVAGAGDVNGDGYHDVILGVPSWENGETDEGRATVFHGSADLLPAVADWTVESDVADAEFGLAAGAAGDVNGDGYDDVVVGSNGMAYLFVGSSSGLAETSRWTAPMTVSTGNPRGTVGGAGDVNGDGYDDVIVGSVGLAEVYHGSSDGLLSTPQWTVSGAFTFGLSASRAGDVDGDGFDDVVVGAFTDGESDEGRAFLFQGSASGLATTPSWIGEGSAGAFFGNAVATAGDVNGDGRAEVIVGARGWDEGWNIDAGRAFVFQGLPPAVPGPAGAIPDGITGAPLVVARGVDGTIRLTWSVSCHASDADYALYEGVLGDFAGHEPVVCGTGGLTWVELEPGPGSHYYLVVPLSRDHEGSYGLDGEGDERLPGSEACLPQALAGC
jgi:hypothetical protein